jgi:hypothetical protein
LKELTIDEMGDVVADTFASLGWEWYDGAPDTQRAARTIRDLLADAYAFELDGECGVATIRTGRLRVDASEDAESGSREYIVSLELGHV